MLLKRFFERTRIRSSGDTNKKTCLCTTNKQESYYDDTPTTSIKKNERQQSFDQCEFIRSDKSKRSIRQVNIEESDGDDEMDIREKLRNASSHSPANIPMLVVVSFNPDEKGLQRQQIEIQRGFPVNAQFIINEWLFVKTADNEEGFVPYICCRPMLRRHSLKHVNDIENYYKPYDFEKNRTRQTKSPLNIPTITPPTNKKFSLSSALGSHSFLFQNSFSSRKRQDLTSSSCGADSGFSDCESSSQNHHYKSFDLSTHHHTRLSNIRSLRSLSNTSKKSNLHVEDFPLKTSSKNNQNSSINSKSDGFNPTKSQLSISNNSAFTQFVKKSTNLKQQENILSYHSNTRLFHNQQDLSSSISNLRNPYESSNKTRKLFSSSSKCSSTSGVSSNMSSPYIRRTPFARRSLPHHNQPILKKSLKPMLSSSPDPHKTAINTEQQLRYVVHAEPSLTLANLSSTSTIERHFSDLSLNQIENDSLLPAKSSILSENQPSLSCSTTSTTSSPSSSSSDDSSTAFIHIKINSSRGSTLHQDDSIPVVFSNKNINSTTKSSSFIHNVSITV